MDIEHLHRLNFSGQTLNVEERAGLEAAMAKRSSEEETGELFFWGKLIGMHGAYLVCYSLVEKSDIELPVKKFFYCTLADFELKELPALSDVEKRLAERHENDRYEGDPQKEVATYENKEAEEEEEAEVVFREYQRLTHTVERIDADVSTVPKGAYVVDPVGRIIANPYFRGLAPHAAADLANYVHFRAAADPKRRAAAELRDEGSTDFMDPLSEDKPRGVWALQHSVDRGTVTLRSLRWPGYFFYHRVAKGAYGGAYFGDGRINTDIVFML